MFNLQSGRLHQSFPTLPLRSQIQASSKGHGKAPFAVDNSETKHTKAVTGLMVDGLNQTVISCGLDGKVKVSIAGNPSPWFVNMFLISCDYSSGSLCQDAWLVNLIGIR